MRRGLLTVLAVVGSLSAPAAARADVARLWVEGRGDVYGGSSDLFTRFDNRIGLGVEAGLELLGLTVFGEGLMLGTDQYLVTGNLGLDAIFGEKARLTIGVYTGPMLMIFPESTATGVDFSTLPAEQQAALESSTGMTVAQAQAEFDGYARQEEDLGRSAFGWNLVRGRVGLDVRLVPGFFLGVAGQLAYHLLISGEDVAAGAKNEAFEKFAAEHDLPPEVAAQLRDAIGAKPVDKDALDGFNYDAHAYLRLEF
jgi:hypothetical protein